MGKGRKKYQHAVLAIFLGNLNKCATRRHILELQHGRNIDVALLELVAGPGCIEPDGTAQNDVLPRQTDCSADVGPLSTWTRFQRRRRDRLPRSHDMGHAKGLVNVDARSNEAERLL